MLEKVECVGFVDRTVAIHVSRLVYRVRRGKYSVLQQVQGIGFVDCTVTVDIPPQMDLCVLGLRAGGHCH